MKQKMFRKTEGWMKRNTRPLECSRWACLFEYCTVEDVVEKLSAFQNSDGGFDQGFEPDSMLPDSNAIDTWTACQILLEIKADKDEPIVQDVKDYLMQSYDSENGLW